MVPHGGQGDSEESRVRRRLYDELESILRRLPEDRLEALGDYLDEQEETEETDAGGDSAEDDS
jgi:hypothetical protein